MSGWVGGGPKRKPMGGITQGVDLEDGFHYTHIRGSSSDNVAKQHLALLNQGLKTNVPGASIAVTQMVTHMNPEPTTEYQYAERIRRDAQHLEDPELIVSVLNVFRKRVTEVVKARKPE